MTSVWNEPLLGAVGRWGLMLLTVFVLFILSAFPFEIAHLGEVRPFFMLMAVYYWTILRPSLLPPPATFVIGIILDLLFNWPFGMNAVVLVTAQALTLRQRKFLLGQLFLVIWAGFALMALMAGAAQWMLFALFNMTLISVKPMLVSSVLSALLFPLMVLPLMMLHKALAARPSAAP
ncbi:MAG: rod shape-determining protein MreD [Pseudomonadota bacterium]